MTDIKNANAPGRHPRGIPNKTHVDSGLASTLTDQLIGLQNTITEAIAATKIHTQDIDELFFLTIHRDVDFLIDRISAFGMDAAADMETAEETGGEA